MLQNLVNRVSYAIYAFAYDFCVKTSVFLDKKSRALDWKCAEYEQMFFKEKYKK